MVGSPPIFALLVSCLECSFLKIWPAQEETSKDADIVGLPVKLPGRLLFSESVNFVFFLRLLYWPEPPSTVLKRRVTVDSLFVFLM